MGECWPVSVATLSLFIAFLVDRSYAPSTVSTYVSAIGYIHKINGARDPTSAFLITKMLQACHKHSKRVDTRLPIDKTLLARLLRALQHTIPSVTRRTMFAAMFSLAFHAFLRIGEITVNSAKHPHTANLIMLDQLAIQSKHMTINFRSYKHSQGQPFSLHITQGAEPTECPIFIMRAYLRSRGPTSGALFISGPQTPVTRREFNDQLHAALTFCNVKTQFFKSHSFRIGAATAAAAQGMSDSQIRQLGRWKSDAFKQYIRTANRVSSL
jgi:hypothetical protein